MKYDYTGDKRDEQDENCRGDGLAIGDSFGAALGETFGGGRDGDDSGGTERDAEMERDTKLADSLGSGFGGLGDGLSGGFGMGRDRDRDPDLLRSEANGRFVPGDAPEVSTGRRNPNNGHYTGPTEPADLGLDGGGSLLGDDPGRALAGIRGDITGDSDGDSDGGLL